MAKDILSKKSPDGTQIGQSSTDLISFWCGTPSTIFALTCLGTTCVVASVVSKWNDFVSKARTRGFSS